MIQRSLPTMKVKRGAGLGWVELVGKCVQSQPASTIRILHISRIGTCLKATLNGWGWPKRWMPGGAGSSSGKRTVILLLNQLQIFTMHGLRNDLERTGERIPLRWELRSRIPTLATQRTWEEPCGRRTEAPPGRR